MPRDWIEMTPSRLILFDLEQSLQKKDEPRYHFEMKFFIRIHFLFYSFRFYFITNGQLSILLYNLLEFFPFYPSCSSSSQPIHDDHQLSRKLIFLLTQSEEMLQFQTFMARILCETSSSKG